MLKQAFGQYKKLQEVVVLLSNAYGIKIDDFVDSSNKKNVISHHQSRNVTSPQVPSTGSNRVINYSEMEEGATGRNRVVRYFDKGERMEGVNGDISKVSFLN